MIGWIAIAASVFWGSFATAGTEFQRRYTQPEINLASVAAEQALRSPVPVRFYDHNKFRLSLRGLHKKRVSILAWEVTAPGPTLLSVGTIVRANDQTLSISINGTQRPIRRDAIVDIFVDAASLQTSSLDLGLADGIHAFPEGRYREGSSISQLSQNSAIEVDLNKIGSRLRSLVGTRVLGDSMAFLEGDRINPSIVLSIGKVTSVSGNDLIIQIGRRQSELSILNQNHLYILP